VRWLAGISAAALAWRVAYVLVWGKDPLVFADGLYYHLQASVLGNGFGFVNPISVAYLQGEHASATHPPLFSLVLFLVTRSGRALGFGAFDSTLVHQLTCAVISTSAVVVIGLVGYRLAGARACVIAALLAAVYPPLWVSDALVMSETLFVLTIALVLLAVYAFYQRPTYGNAAWCGLALAAAMLTRSEAALLVPIVGIPLVAGRTERSRWWRTRALGLMAIVAVAVCMPWAVRNVLTFKKPVLLSENIDSAVAGANCTSTYYGDRIGTWDIHCHTLPQPRGDESEVGAELRHRGIEYAREHERRIPLVVSARVGRTFLLFKPLADRDESGRSPWTQWATVFLYFPIQVLAVFGLVALRRRRVTIWPLVAMAILVVVTSVLTYGISRFRVPWDVASVVAAAIAIDAFLSRGVMDGRSPAGERVLTAPMASDEARGVDRADSGSVASER
jgi:4-amino-4-deoxy-L-arabinose transferase-like glycosyltransferase